MWVGIRRWGIFCGARLFAADRQNATLGTLGFTRLAMLLGIRYFDDEARAHVEKRKRDDPADSWNSPMPAQLASPALWHDVAPPAGNSMRMSSACPNRASNASKLTKEAFRLGSDGFCSTKCAKMGKSFGSGAQLQVQRPSHDIVHANVVLRAACVSVAGAPV